MMKIPAFPHPLLRVIILIIVFFGLAGCAPKIEKLKSDGSITKLIDSLDDNESVIRVDAARALV